uniref:Uncharacterized protein n=1 Tax=Oscillatoriales cyanobacterium SpSt-402 TaxID=2282168 RepID=A0A832H4E2_9CYAN
MQGTQLELNLQQALADPPTADLKQLWWVLEEVLQPLPEQQQLQIAGEAIAQIVEVVCGRAQQILNGLEYSQHPFTEAPQIEICLSREFLEPFIRQSVSLNLDQLLAPPTSRQREKGIQSVVGECNKEALLLMLDEEQAKQQALAVAHVEAVEDWSTRLREFFMQTDKPALLNELVQDLQMDWVEIWLGLLLGDFKLEQQGEFYDPKTILCGVA